MQLRKVLFRIGFMMMTGVVILSMGGPVSEAAALPLLIDDAGIATDCGKYTGKTAETNAVTAINGATTGQTILICPGTYDLNRIGALGALTINGKKLTMKRAVPSGVGSRPTLVFDPDTSQGINATNATLTIDGLVFDGHTNTQAGFNGIKLTTSALTFKNSAVIGPGVANSKGIASNNDGNAKAVVLTASACAILGYTSSGIEAVGFVKVSVSACLLDSSDGGRLAAHQAGGVDFNGLTAGPAPSGSVTKSTLLNHSSAVLIRDSSKIKVSSNFMSNNLLGASISANGFHNADGNSFTANNIVGIPNNWGGIAIYDNTTGQAINKTMISKNTLAAGEYAVPAVSTTGILFSLAMAGPATMTTATLSGNLFIGFLPDRRVWNPGNKALVAEKGSESMP